MWKTSLTTLVAALLLFCERSEPPVMKQLPRDPRRAAIGAVGGLPVPLQRALDPVHAELIPKAGPVDWLSVYKEEAQSFNQYEHSNVNRPDALRHTIYLQPLGTFGSDAPSLEMMRRYAAAYFMLDVKLLDPLPIDARLTSRLLPGTNERQLRTGDILAMLKQRLPADAYCIIAVTMIDLYPGPDWNFVFGQASLTDRVGVYSFARYGDRSKSITLRRSCDVLAHETGHMFGIRHCVWYRCVMNGSNNLHEFDGKPMHACPVDLRKLQWSTGFDVVQRYERLRDVCRDAGFDEERAWIETELARIASGSGATQTAG